MKPFHYLSSQFVIAVTIGGVETHLQISGVGRQEFQQRAGSLMSERIRAKGGEPVNLMNATKFNWEAVKAQAATLFSCPGVFPEFEKFAIVRIS